MVIQQGVNRGLGFKSSSIYLYLMRNITTFDNENMWRGFISTNLHHGLKSYRFREGGVLSPTPLVNVGYNNCVRCLPLLRLLWSHMRIGFYFFLTPTDIPHNTVSNKIWIRVHHTSETKTGIEQKAKIGKSDTPKPLSPS